MEVHLNWMIAVQVVALTVAGAGSSWLAIHSYHDMVGELHSATVYPLFLLLQSVLGIYSGIVLFLEVPQSQLHFHLSCFFLVCSCFVFALIMEYNEPLKPKEQLYHEKENEFGAWLQDYVANFFRQVGKTAKELGLKADETQEPYDVDSVMPSEMSSNRHDLEADHVIEARLSTTATNTSAVKILEVRKDVQKEHASKCLQESDNSQREDEEQQSEEIEQNADIDAAENEASNVSDKPTASDDVELAQTTKVDIGTVV